MGQFPLHNGVLLMITIYKVCPVGQRGKILVMAISLYITWGYVSSTLMANNNLFDGMKIIQYTDPESAFLRMI